MRAVKLFPAGLIGPDGLRALRGPFPDVAFVPTGGIATNEVGRWLDAGALAVGVGGRLAPPTLHEDLDGSELTSRVQVILDELSRRPPPLICRRPDVRMPTVRDQIGRKTRVPLCPPNAKEFDTAGAGSQDRGSSTTSMSISGSSSVTCMVGGSSRCR